MTSLIDKVERVYRQNPQLCYFLTILTASLISFWKLQYFSFLIGWDDQWFITNHYTEDGFTKQNIIAIATDFYYGQYAPINQLYYTTVFKIFDYNTAVFHILSVIIHLLNSYMVFKFIQGIYKYLSSGVTNNDGNSIAFLTCTFFTLSPFNLEPIAWIAASKVLIYALFYLLSLNTYMKYISYAKPAYFYLSMIFFILSFGAKEQAITLPACLILIDYITGRSMSDKMVWYEKIPFIVLSLFMGLITIQSQGAVGNNQFYSISDRFLLFFYTLTEYFVKTILPINVSYLYPFPFTIGKQAPWWLWIYPTVIPLFIYLYRHYFWVKSILFGSLFFIIHILIVSNIISLARNSIVADRYAYLSTIGIYYLLAKVFINNISLKKYRRLTYIFLLVYVSYFVVYSNYHSQVWTNAITLKEKIRTIINNREDFKEWKKTKDF